MAEFEVQPAGGNTRQLMRELNSRTPIVLPGTRDADESRDGHPAERASMLLTLRTEFDGYRREMCAFSGQEPDQVMMALSAFSARASEVRVQLWRDGGRLAQKMRTEELDPFLDECERQFKYHSRLQTVRELDWRMTSGAPS